MAEFTKESAKDFLTGDMAKNLREYIRDEFTEGDEVYVLLEESNVGWDIIGIHSEKHPAPKSIQNATASVRVTLTNPDEHEWFGEDAFCYEFIPSNRM